MTRARFAGGEWEKVAYGRGPREIAEEFCHPIGTLFPRGAVRGGVVRRVVEIEVDGFLSWRVPVTIEPTVVAGDPERIGDTDGSFWWGSDGIVLLTGRPGAQALAISRFAADAAIISDSSLGEVHYKDLSGHLAAEVFEGLMSRERVLLTTQRWDIVEAFHAWAESDDRGKLVRATIEGGILHLTHFGRLELAVAVRDKIEVR